jgi:hypothetical protein
MTVTVIPRTYRDDPGYKSLNRRHTGDLNRAMEAVKSYKGDDPFIIECRRLAEADASWYTTPEEAERVLGIRKQEKGMTGSQHGCRWNGGRLSAAQSRGLATKARTGRLGRVCRQHRLSKGWTPR